tara:strand:+ start:4483 stop:5238 length:756 start_codon:yes stop_codon:yes gene_type:complete
LFNSKGIDMRWIDLIDKRYLLTAMQLLGLPIALYAVIAYGTIAWLSISFVIFMLMNVLGGTIAYHRIHCHSTHKMHPVVEFVCTFLGLHATYSSPIDFAAIHVAHHKYSDTEKDPHSFKHMGFKTFFPILWDTGGPMGGDLRTVVRLMRNKITLFFHRNHFILLAAPYLLLFISIELFFFAYFVPTVTATLSTGYSTFNHNKNGPYDRGLLYSLATGGEHRHVWHHNNPGDTSGEGWLDTVINIIAKKRVC